MSTHTFRTVCFRLSVAAFSCVLLPALAAAQPPAPVAPQGPTAVVALAAGPAGPAVADPTADQTKAPPVRPAPAPTAKTPPSKLSRWFEFQTGSLAGRYRYVETSKGIWTANQLQYTGQFKGRFKFDPKGRASVTVLFATGSAFTSGWNNTGVGTGDAVRMWPLKQIYASVVPVTGVEASFGSMGFVRGESTEITSYDNDGYLSGERVTVKRPKDLFFDELTFTSAFLGDLTTPAVWDRWASLTDSRNFFQYFAGKKITKSVAASADYSRLAGVGTFRVGVSAKTPKARVVDSLRYEHYARRGEQAAYGFAVFGEKAVTKRFTAGVGFANIDPRYAALNADRFGKGKRVYESLSFKVTPDFSFQAFMTQGVDNDFAISNKYRVDIIATYNVLGAFQRRGMLK